MALVVEDGTAKSDAESYLSVTDADTYWTEHGSPATWTGADAVKEAALRYATQWIDDQWHWRGEVVSNTQALRWPRAGVADDEGRTIDSDTIPERLKQAVAQAAGAHLAGSGLATIQKHGIDRVKVDVVEVDFSGGSGQQEHYPLISLLLRGLYSYGGGAVRTVRG